MVENASKHNEEEVIYALELMERQTLRGYGLVCNHGK